MKSRKFICMAVAIFLLGKACSGQAQELDAATKEKVESAVHKAMQAGGLPSVQVGIARGGKVVYSAAFGDARVGEQGMAAVPATTEMSYPVGSISKQFTAASLLLLQERGKLKLDDPVAKWFPQLTRANDITIRMLLTHTSGYSDYWPQDYLLPEMTKSVRPEEVVLQWAEKPLDFEPGTKQQYSNTNYVLAAMIVEKVSGQPFFQFVKQNIVDPLHLKGVYGVEESGYHKEPVGYTRNALGPLRESPKEAKGWVFGTGELAMPASTLLDWDNSLMGRTLLKPESYTEMFKEQRLKNGGATGSALGLQVGRAGGGRLFMLHNGELGGFAGMNACLPEENIAVVVLTNRGSSDAATALVFAVMPIVAPPLPQPAADNTPSATTVEARGVLNALQRGEIDHGLFTGHANFYFNQQTVDDFRTSLAPLGAVTGFTETHTALRGGLQMRAYTAKFASQTVAVSTYWTPDGKIEQFLIEPVN
jgi:CubicO group peptidase (beta-lactamase class C family)